MSTLFDDPDGTFLVLVNADGQYSLWPDKKEKPPGWSVTHGSDSRHNCLEFISRSWDDMRPQSLKDEKREETTP